MDAIVALIAIAAALGAVIIGARRFARRRMREGLWNENGPIDPSLPPTDFLQVYPRPWGIQRPSIDSIDEENPFTDVVNDHPDHESHR